MSDRAPRLSAGTGGRAPAKLRAAKLRASGLLALFGCLCLAPAAGAYAADGVHANPGPSSLARPAFAEQLQAARTAYFADLEGDRGADDRARQQFAALHAAWPGQPVVEAYLGSLELLESGRTLAVWRKHTLAQEGLEKLDSAVSQAPDSLEARFVRALTTWHLPFFFHRKEQAEQDLGFLAPRAEQAAHQGSLPAPLAAAALDYWGQVLADRGAQATIQARQAFEAAVRVAPSSPAAEDARKRLAR
ncbi:MAG TPA: hypothetical protein VGD62_05070 [Acidobacteriaceae bacterium]